MASLTSLLQIDIIMVRISLYLDRRSITRLRVPCRTWRNSARNAPISVVVWAQLLLSMPGGRRRGVGIATLRRDIAPHYVVTALILRGAATTRMSSDMELLINAVRACRDGREGLTPPGFPPMSAADIDDFFADSLDPSEVEKPNNDDDCSKLAQIWHGLPAEARAPWYARAAQLQAKHEAATEAYEAADARADAHCEHIVAAYVRATDDEFAYALKPCRLALRSLHIVSEMPRDAELSRTDWTDWVPNRRVSPAAESTSLRSLGRRDRFVNELTSLRAATGFETLVTITLDGCERLADVSALATCTRLERLEIRDASCAFESARVEALASCEQLRSFTLSFDIHGAIYRGWLSRARRAVAIAGGARDAASAEPVARPVLPDMQPLAACLRLVTVTLLEDLAPNPTLATLRASRPDVAIREEPLPPDSEEDLESDEDDEGAHATDPHWNY